MKVPIKGGVLLISMVLSVSAFAQKKVQQFTVSRVIKAPANKVWAVVGEDFGAIAKSHPGIISSEYIGGTLKGGEGTERVCNLNEKGSKYTHERQVEYNPDEYRFKAKVFHANGLPMDSKYTYAVYDVDPIDSNSSRLSFSMNYRTKPAFLGAVAKGGFKKTIAGYLLAVEHHVLTGETVNRDNFKSIKKQYSE